MKKHIPNAITSINLLSGCITIVLLFSDFYRWAFIAMAVGMVADFFDGMAARLLNVRSELGLQLDSLADLVSFGVFPGMVMFVAIQNSIFLPELFLAGFPLFAFAALLIPVFSAIRLGRFNLDTRQTEKFIGLPTPANAIIIVSFCLYPFVFEQNSSFDTFMFSISSNFYVLLAITLISCWILNSEISFFSFKFKNLNWNSNAIRYIFLFIALILAILFQFRSIPLIMLSYLLISIFSNLFRIKSPK